MTIDDYLRKSKEQSENFHYLLDQIYSNQYVPNRGGGHKNLLATGNCKHEVFDVTGIACYVFDNCRDMDDVCDLTGLSFKLLEEADDLCRETGRTFEEIGKFLEEHHYV